MTRFQDRLAGTAALAAIATTQAIAQTATPAEGAYPQGTQISVGIASTPGGGYDRYGRLIAAHLGRHLPGSPAIVPKNMVGAGGHVLGRYVSGIAPRDGTWLALVLPSTITSALYRDKAAFKYDPAKLIHIGSANSEIDMCFVRADSGIKSLKEALTKSISVGATAPGSATFEQPLVLNRLVGAKFKLVAGYPGTRQIILALERNEVAGVCGMSYSGMRLQRAKWLDEKFILPISQNHTKGDPALNAQGIPRAPDLVSAPDDRKAIELIYSQQLFGRPFVVAEGTPSARVRILRKAFMDAMRDPQLLAQARKMRLDIAPVPGEELQALVERLYATPPAIVRRAADALKAGP